MADRDERSRLSAFSPEMPLERLSQFAAHADLRRNFAEGGTVDDILSAYSAPVRSWPGEQALDDEARANYAAMHPEPKKLRPDEAYRGMFLPFRETTEGNHEWAVPGIFMDPADAAKAIHASSGTSLGAMARPSQLNSEALDEILGIGGAGALTGIMGNMPRVLAKPSAGATELGIFGGRRGAEKLAAAGDNRPLHALDVLEAMEKGGASRDEIWAATNKLLEDSPYAGAFRGSDKKPRFEIDDSASALTTMPNRLGMLHGQYGNILRHDLLSEAYPSVSGYDTLIMHSPGKGGSFTPPRSRDGVKGAEITAQASGPEKMRDVLLHEGQHGVQNFEGFARGANLDQFPIDRLRQDAFEDASRKIQGLMELDPDAASSFRARNRHVADLKTKYGPDWGALATDRELGALDMIETDLMLNTRVGRALLDADWSRAAQDAMPEEFWHNQAMDKYKSVAGEAEARLVQARRDLTPEERRSRPPWLDYDIPEKDQIVRFGDKGPQMSMSDDASRPPLPMDEASRLARAREMGFDTDTRWVHVTDQDFDAFSKRPKMRNTDEEGMHLARLGTWATDRPAFVSHRTGMDADGGRSIPLYQRGELYDAGTLTDLWDMAKERGFKKRLQDEGYSGIRVRDNEFSRPVPSDKEKALRSRIDELDAENRKLGVEFNEKAGVGHFDAALRDRWLQGKDEVAALWQELKAERNKRVATSIVMFEPKDFRGVNSPFDPAHANSPKILASHHIPLPVPREDERIPSVDDILNLYAKD